MPLCITLTRPHQGREKTSRWQNYRLISFVFSKSILACYMLNIDMHFHFHGSIQNGFFPNWDNVFFEETLVGSTKDDKYIGSTATINTCTSVQSLNLSV